MPSLRPRLTRNRRRGADSDKRQTSLEQAGAWRRSAGGGAPSSPTGHRATATAHRLTRPMRVPSSAAAGIGRHDAPAIDLPIRLEPTIRPGRRVGNCGVRPRRAARAVACLARRASPGIAAVCRPSVGSHLQQSLPVGDGLPSGIAAAPPARPSTRRRPRRTVASDLRIGRAHRTSALAAIAASRAPAALCRMRDLTYVA